MTSESRVLVTMHPSTEPRGKIVIADDDAPTRIILSQILKRRNFNVIAVENGKLACEAVRREHPDLVLLDCMMPIMNGRAALSELKADHGTRAIPIMMLTTQSQVAEKVSALADGAQDYLTKPFDAQELIARIEQHMGWRSLLNVEADTAFGAERIALLADSERRYRMLAEAMPQMIWLTGPSGDVSYCNRAWENYTGTGHLDMRNGGWYVLVHPADRTRCARAWATSLATGKPYEIEYRIRRASDGMQRWHIGRATPVRDPFNKIVGWVGSCTDNHDFKIANEMREALDAIPHIVSIHDDAGFVEYVSPRWNESLGLPAEAALGFGWRNYIHPDDARIPPLTPEKIVRMRGIDESYHRFLTRTEIFRDARDAPRRWLSTFTDLDESSVQAAFAASEARYRALIAAMPQAVWILDSHGTIVFANERWSQYTGVAVDGHLSVDASGVIDADGLTSINAMRALDPPTEFACEARIRRSDGTYRWNLIAAAPLPDTPGDTGKWVVSGTDIDERKASEVHIATAAATLARLAHYDELTGLANRVLLMNRLSDAMALARRRAGRVLVLFVDLDHFKSINDAFGHGAGDAVLAEVGRRLTSALRVGDTAGRVGGDEFILVCAAGERAADEAIRLADRVLVAITAPIEFEGMSLTVGASIGIALYPDDAVDADCLIGHADQAMYGAKRSGRNAYCLHDPDAGNSAPRGPVQ